MIMSYLNIKKFVLYIFPKVHILFMKDYIINEKKSLKDITKSLLKLKNNQINELYFLMGVYDHFFVLRLSNLTNGHHV